MRQRGFTLIELLVVVAIITVLLSLLMPSLNNARRQSKQVACLSNLRQLGVALRIYNDENNNLLPQVYKDYSPVTTYLGQTIYYIGPNPKTNAIASNWLMWANYLFVGGQINTNSAFICPESLPSLSMPLPYSSYAATQRIWTEVNPGKVGIDRLSRIPVPAEMAMLTDCNRWWTHQAVNTYSDYVNSYVGAPGDQMNFRRHVIGINVVMFDGHAESVKEGRARTDLWLWGDNLKF